VKGTIKGTVNAKVRLGVSDVREMMNAAINNMRASPSCRPSHQSCQRRRACTNTSGTWSGNARSWNGEIAFGQVNGRFGPFQGHKKEAAFSDGLDRF
jgi:hypothetical protein